MPQMDRPYIPTPTGWPANTEGRSPEYSWIERHPPTVLVRVERGNLAPGKSNLPHEPADVRAKPQPASPDCFSEMRWCAPAASEPNCSAGDSWRLTRFTPQASPLRRVRGSSIRLREDL